MKYIHVVLLTCLLVMMVAMNAYAGEKAPPKVRKLAEDVLAKFGSDSVIVAAVKAENEKKKTLEQIKKIDEKWINTIGIDEMMESMMNLPCSQHLNNIKKTADFYEEIFVMDNQGANVAMTNKTSDYWQGDEAKFVKCYKGGSGEISISDVKFDDSTQVYLTQVSVPVLDEEQTIGVMTFGINVDKIK